MSAAMPSPQGAHPGLFACAAIAGVLHGAFLLAEGFRTDQGLAIESGWLYLVYLWGDHLLRALLTLPLFALTLQALGRLRATGARRWVAKACLLLTCALLSTALMASLPYPPLAIAVGASASIEAWCWYKLWANLLVGVLAMLGADHLREHAQAAERLAQAQDRGRAARERVARAQLQAIQARVDPQLLFETLKRVKNFYEQEPDRAERVLDELAAFLRAALPALRNTRSCVELEFQLVACYARLLQIAFDRRGTCKLDVPPDVGKLDFPAGLLLPLTIDLLQGGGGFQIGLAASADAHRVRVAVSADTVPSVAVWQRLRAALADLYGDRASCRWTSASHAAHARTLIELVVRHEPT